MKPEILNGALPGSKRVTHESVEITAQNFLKSLEHFASYAHPRKQNSTLILMDNHALHVTLETINFCTDNGNVYVDFPVLKL